MRNVEILDASRKVPFLEDVVRRQANAGAPIEILEAGCGQRWLLKLDREGMILTGVDIDKDALEIRKNVRKDLDEAIHGDLRTIDFGSRRFDVIYSAFVIEHIEGAEGVLSRMVGWLKPNGVLIIEMPDPDSVKGLITRISPHWFHVFYYRFILGIKTAGQSGHGPYRTHFEPVVSRPGMHAFGAKNNMPVEAEYAFATDGPRNRIMRAFIAAATKAVNLLTLTRFSDRHADLLYVLRRQV